MNNIRAEHYDRQPLWFNLINRAWKGSYPLGTRSSLSKDSLIRAARKSTGLTDFGPYFWEEPIDRMLASIREEAKLHPIGQFITRQRIIQLLSVRLRAEDWFKKHPEILEQPLYPVILIIGLQRTGTTKLQRLLAADPGNRALLSWEALNPAPLNGDIADGRERIKVARTSEKALKFMSPGFFAIHPVEHLAPEEDVLLLDVSFLSTTAEATMHVPSYAAWLEQTDQSAAYEYMARLLKLLQWQRPGKRWVLKTPHHLEFPDLAKKSFGDVHFVWTHRNVYESIPSFMSMVSYARRLFSDQVDPVQVAQHWLRKTGFMLDRALDFHSRNNNTSLFTQVCFEQLVEDPMRILGEIYGHRQETISPELMKTFEETDQGNPRGKYGRHEYSLDHFGLDQSKVDHYTAKYRQFQESIKKKALL
jgi:hypothetical protein